MIKPHGSDTLNPLYVMDAAKRSELLEQAKHLPSVVICSAAAANAVMLGAGSSRTCCATRHSGSVRTSDFTAKSSASSRAPSRC